MSWLADGFEEHLGLSLLRGHVLTGFNVADLPRLPRRDVRCWWYP